MKISKKISIVSILGIVSLLMISCTQLDKLNEQPQKTKITKEQTESYLEYLKALKGDEIVHLAIGDSVVKGVGAPQGNNYVDLVSERISNITGKKVTKINDGINGLTSSELKTNILNGQLDEHIKSANLITLNIGGNDLLRITVKDGILKAAKMFQETKNAYGKNLDEILAHIQEVNPNAKIIVLELYNPVQKDEKYEKVAEKLLKTWNASIYNTASEKDNVAVAKIADVIADNEGDKISPDGVHPNENGYKAISEEVYATLHKAKINN